jgi:hypothetical protein
MIKYINIAIYLDLKTHKVFVVDNKGELSRGVTSLNLEQFNYVVELV